MSIQLTTVDEVSNLVISILVMQMLKRIGNLSESTILKLRIVFAFFQALQLLMIFISKKSITSTKDQRKLKLPKQDGLLSSAEEDEEEEITYSEYDMRELKKLYKSVAIQLAISVFCHWKWKIIQPFIIQSIGVAKSYFMKPIFIAHVRGIEVIRPYEKNLLFQNLSKKTDVERRKKDN